jgi:hypothetical protein
VRWFSAEKQRNHCLMLPYKHKLPTSRVIFRTIIGMHFYQFRTHFTPSILFTDLFIYCWFIDLLFYWSIDLLISWFILLYCFCDYVLPMFVLEFRMAHLSNRLFTSTQFYECFWLQV